MTPPDDQSRLRHLRDAAERITEFASGNSRESLAENEMLKLALTKLVEIVGEAAKQVSQPTRAEYPGIPWSAAARMRDRLVHHYFDIDLDILWTTVTADIPALLALLPDRPFGDAESP